MAIQSEAQHIVSVTKFCSGCGQKRSSIAFGVRRSAPDGLNPHCKECRRSEARASYQANLSTSRAKGAAKAREWRKGNRQRVNEAASRWRAKNRKAKPTLSPDEIALKNAERKQRKSDARKRTYQKHKDKVLATAALYRAAHKAEEKANRAAHYQRNKDRVSELTKAYRIANPELYRAADARRRAVKLQATPSWADLKAIRAFYDEAERLTRKTGVLHEVDHIYPLQGRTCCGLHIAANLQILTRTQNRSKSNNLPANT